MSGVTPPARDFPWVDSHPFISFDPDLLRRLPPPVLVWLGECSSKIEHISKVPFQPKTAQELLKIFIVKGIHGTTAIEGNTLSEEQVAKQIEGELKLPPSQAYLGEEVTNVVKAYNWLIQQIQAGAPLHIRPADLRRLNSMVLEGLEVRDEVVPGEFRDHVVGVNDYRAPKSEFVPELVDRLCRWMNDDGWEAGWGGPYVLAILKAIVAHLYIAWIHPFGDGNGRTARLVEFDILTRAGVPAISAHLLSDHYNRTRGAYYRALSAARRDPMAFVGYAVEGFVDGLREQIDRIWIQNSQVVWTNYVHDRFREIGHSDAMHRRRDVAIFLGVQDKPVFWKDIPSLNPRLAAAYADSQRMLQRDLNFLVDAGLVVRGAGDYMSANSAVLQAFLPLRNHRRPDSATPC